MLHTLISNPVNKTSWNKMDMVTNLLCFIIIFAAQCIVASTASDLFVDHILAEKSVFLNKDAGYSLTKKGDALKTSLHDVTFAIKQQNLDQLNQILYEVSDPRNPKYGQHWTRQQVTSLVSNPSATENVQKYLEDRGIHVEKVSKYGEYIQATATISTWEELFQTQFFEFHDEVYDITFARALEYSLPALISGDLTGVLGVADYFPPIGAAAIQPATDRLKKITTEAISSLKNKRSLKSNGKKSSTDSSPTLLCVDAGYSLCMAYPQLLYDYYNISSPYGSNSVTQGIYGSLNQAFSPIDLTTFQEGFNVTVHPIAGSINGHVYNNACYVSIDDCAEASLDIQYITSIAQSVPTYYYYYADATLNGFANWLVAVSEMDNPPDLFSISYGGNEAGTSISSEQSFNTEAQKLGVMGISLINSSGDNGAPGSSAAGHPGNCAYAPAFPSSSPYVTSVGATQGPEYGNPEITCQVPNSVITSGGGFSARNSVPSWQSSFVSSYFVTAATDQESPVTGYSTTGRGYPDVAILGNNYAVVLNGSANALSGTSASSPVFAGIVSLANSKRKAAGLSTLGFLNPLLYANYASFVHDVVEGDNKCTSAYDGVLVNNTVQYIGTCCKQGFYATAGWDPVTGLGSINVAKFLDFIDLLATATPTPSVEPTFVPTAPTFNPSHNPTHAPSTRRPSAEPTFLPSYVSAAPSFSPSHKPTHEPSTSRPSAEPTFLPTHVSAAPTNTHIPTREPTTRHPSEVPSHAPSTIHPTAKPTPPRTIEPTAPPTFPPSPFPSFAPSQQASTILSFQSTININNITITADFALSGADQEAICLAAASSMGLEGNQVTFVSSSIQLTRRALRNTDKSALVAKTMAAQKYISASVMTSVLVDDSSSPQDTYVSLTSALSYSINNSTVFDQYLRSAADTVGSTVMKNAVATGVSELPPTIQTFYSDDDGSPDTLSLGGLIGVVIGGIFAIALIGVAIYCIFASSLARPAKGLAEKQGDGISESGL